MPGRATHMPHAAATSAAKSENLGLNMNSDDPMHQTIAPAPAGTAWTEAEPVKP